MWWDFEPVFRFVKGVLVTALVMLPFAAWKAVELGVAAARWLAR